MDAGTILKIGPSFVADKGLPHRMSDTRNCQSSLSHWLSLMIV